MENKVLNFVKMEVTGNTKAEALEQAPFFVQGDATQAFKKWKESQSNTIVTESDIDVFLSDYLAKRGKCAPNLGFFITLEPAVANTKSRPYKVEKVKGADKGPRKYVTTYQIYDEKTGVLLGSTTETKAKAEEIAKKLYVEGFTGDIVCTYTKQVVEGEPIAFKVKYSPSSNSCVGKYLVFGNKA